MCHVAIVTDHVYNNYVYTTFELALITHSANTLQLMCCYLHRGSGDQTTDATEEVNNNHLINMCTCSFIYILNTQLASCVLNTYNSN